MASIRKGGNLLFSISGYYGLAFIRVAQGHLRKAVSIYEQSLQLVTEHGEALLMVSANLYLGLSEINREKGNLKEARQLMQKSKEVGERSALPDWSYRWHLAQARLKEIEGDLNGTLEMLDDAERLYYRNPVPDMRPLSALRTRIWIRQGRLADTLSWVHDQDLSIDDLTFMHEYEHITFVRFLIAQYLKNGDDRPIQEAIGLLDRLLQAAEKGKRMGSVVEILILQALSYNAQEDIHQALVPLERALVLAEPEGYLRIFLDEGPPIVQLLEEILNTKTNVPVAYVKKLLSASKVDQLIKEKSVTTILLSERELEVLRLIDAGFSNKKIMEELFISNSTVKTHIRNIYSKLDVHSRTEALLKARELNLL
jgi:LuxR family maltose regulon positive regulatory protein